MILAGGWTQARMGTPLDAWVAARGPATARLRQWVEDIGLLSRYLGEERSARGDRPSGMVLVVASALARGRHRPRHQLRRVSIESQAPDSERSQAAFPTLSCVK